MLYKNPRTVVTAAMLLGLATAAAAGAQGQRVLPAGTVILVRTQQALESQSAQVGQTFDTDVLDMVGVDGYTLIPAHSRIRAVVTYAQAATRDQSGVIGLSFDRITMTDGSSYPMVAKLTSTDSAERRQIEASGNQRVVLVGGRGGIGAAIAGAGPSRSPTSSILSALGGLLSEGRDVSLPAGTQLAVQLTQALEIRTRGIARALDANSLLTSPDRIRDAQRELSRLAYYRGPLTGQLDDATQSALVQYQIDKGIRATGNLDWRTAQTLGVATSVSGGDVIGATALTPSEAASMRRTAQALVARERNDLGVSGIARMDAQRAYPLADLDLWFALSAFADNAQLYEQVVLAPANGDGTTAAGRALINAARRVDNAMNSSSASSQVRTAWTGIRGQLGRIAPDYR